MTSRQPPDPKPDREHVLHVALRARSAAALMNVVRRHRVDFNCGGVVAEPDGRFVLDVYVPVSRLEDLEAPGIEAEVMADGTVLGRERMQEVGKGNRFADRKRVPRGLGVKVGTSRR
jgi:hypothetical protein